MDLSALIFVALAVAWAVYLVPRALRAHEEDAVSRSVDGFSEQLRVLARRDAVSGRSTAFVAGEAPVVASPEGEAAQVEQVEVEDLERRADLEQGDPVAPVRRSATPERAAARRAAERRRRVFNVLLLAIVVVAALGIGGVISLAWSTIPVVLMAAWLVLCRVMVRRERALRARRRRALDRALSDEATGSVPAVGEADLGSADTDEIPVVAAASAELSGQESGVGRWAPVDVPLPTYVAKAPAGRSVRTIDLDSTGVWSSGRNEADSQLAREADAQRAQAAEGAADAEVEQRRASGS